MDSLLTNPIKYHRRRLGLSVEQLANRIGVSISSVRQYESENRTPPDAILQRLSKLYGVPVIALRPKPALKSVLADLMAKNAINLDDQNPYAKGYHDAILDIMKIYGISADVSYYEKPAP